MPGGQGLSSESSLTVGNRPARAVINPVSGANVVGRRHQAWPAPSGSTHSEPLRKSQETSMVCTTQHLTQPRQPAVD